MHRSAKRKPFLSTTSDDNNKMMTREIIEAKINNASPLDFGNLFNACIELYKKVWTDGLVLFLVTFLAVIPLGLFIGSFRLLR